MALSPRHQEYWRKNQRLTALLLALWFGVSFVASFFARELNNVTLLGFPLGFYMGAQGSLFVYLLIIWYYARTMNRLDRQYNVHESDSDRD